MLPSSHFDHVYEFSVHRHHYNKVTTGGFFPTVFLTLFQLKNPDTTINDILGFIAQFMGTAVEK